MIEKILKLFKVNLHKRSVGIVKKLVDAVDELKDNNEQIRERNKRLQEKMEKIKAEALENEERLRKNISVIEGLEKIGF